MQSKPEFIISSSELTQSNDLNNQRTPYEREI